MTYGKGKDICVGMFLDDKSWIDFNRHWSVVGPKLQHFQYADDKKDAAMLLEDFHVRVGTRVFSALAGFDYDGASKPAIVWSLLGPPYSVRSLIQFTLHDEQYVANLLPQSECDWMMLETLGAFGGTSWVNRNLVWSAVKAAGWAVYPKSRRELLKYREYVFMTDLSKTDFMCEDERLAGYGPRKSVRPEIILDWKEMLQRVP